MRIELLNEEGQPVRRYIAHRCWVSEYQALPDLDAGSERRGDRAHQSRERRLGAGLEPGRAARKLNRDQAMFRLPVSRTDVELRHATGTEDILLLEGAGNVVETSIALVGRLARHKDGEELDAAALPVTDIEALLLELRRRVFGELVWSRGRCPCRNAGRRPTFHFAWTSTWRIAARARRPMSSR